MAGPEDRNSSVVRSLSRIARVSRALNQMVAVTGVVPVVFGLCVRVTQVVVPVVLMSSDAITADDLREYVDYWVMGKRANSTQIVHVPAPESTPDAPQPVCENREASSGKIREWDGWMTKSPAVYPAGYVSLCSGCANLVDSDGSILELDAD
jgi:hypothetical protein